MYTNPKKGEYLEILLRSPRTVFTPKDAALLWGEGDKVLVGDRLKKYANSGKLQRVHRGCYVKDKNYNRYELATRINTPAYISFETVLGREGINFQYYGNIFVASYMNREIEVDGQKINFIRMKDYVLSNTMGIEHKDGVAMATKERAFLDRIYITKEYHFDTMSSFNWEKVFEMLPIYHNKRMEKKVKLLFKNYQEVTKTQ